jgi:hypothetical protein
MLVLHNLNGIFHGSCDVIHLLPVQGSGVMYSQAAIAIQARQPRTEGRPRPFRAKDGIDTYSILLVTPCCARDDVYWGLRVDVIPLRHRFVIHRPKPFVRVFMSLDDDINTILIEQFFQACTDNRTRGRAVISVNVGAVHGPVAIRYDPRCLIPVLIGHAKIILQPSVLHGESFAIDKVDLGRIRDEVNVGQVP